MDKVKFALIGTGNRGAGVYAPIIQVLKEDVKFVAVCDANEESVGRVGKQYGVPTYTDTEKMLEEVQPEACAIVVTPSNNHVPGLLCSEHGVSYVTETPLWRASRSLAGLLLCYPYHFHRRLSTTRAL